MRAGSLTTCPSPTNGWAEGLSNLGETALSRREQQAMCRPARGALGGIVELLIAQI